MADVVEKKLGDLPVEEFLAMMLHVMKQHQLAESGGRKTLRELSVEEFQMLINQTVSSRALVGAQQEAKIAETVMRDWSALGEFGIHHITNPARIGTPKQVDELATSMKEFFEGGGRGDFVFVVVIANSDGSYQSVPQARLHGQVKPGRP